MNLNCGCKNVKVKAGEFGKVDVQLLLQKSRRGEFGKVDVQLLFLLRNPWSYTEKRVWVEQHLGFAFVERLIICPNKALLNGDILVDDQTSGRGQELFTGRLWQFGSTELSAFSDLTQTAVTVLVL
jgi:5'(3')-deoxyribonucleotidase